MGPNGAVFSPIRGNAFGLLQPGVQSLESVLILYEIPSNVDLQKLYWGLHYEGSDGLKYGIKLKPESLPTSNRCEDGGWRAYWCFWSYLSDFRDQQKLKKK